MTAEITAPTLKNVNTLFTKLVGTIGPLTKNNGNANNGSLTFKSLKAKAKLSVFHNPIRNNKNSMKKISPILNANNAEKNL